MVELLRLVLPEPIQVVCVVQGTGLSLHQEVHLDLVDHGDEINEAVLDVYACFGRNILVLGNQRLELLVPILLELGEFFEDVGLDFVPHVEVALDVFDEA